MVTYDVTWQSQAEDVEVLTADDLHVPTTVSVKYRARASELYRLHTEIGPNYYQKIIRPDFVTLVRSAFANHEHNNLARQSPAIEDSVEFRLKRTLDTMPIDIGSVAIEHINFDKEVTSSISSKLVKEQQAEQKAFEIKIAEQDSEIMRTMAQGKADAIRIQAEGEAAAIVLKARAQSEAQLEITNTLTRDYLQYKAFDGSATRYYFVPVGKDGLPLLVNTE
jgi:regulator of protease activity HflC (stomatin/prohibitin superfamily)